MELLSILVILLLSQSTTQICNRGVPSDSRYVVIPTTYRGKVVVRNPPCPFVSSGFVCPFSHILGDDVQVSPQPNLDTEDNNNDIAKFIVWRNDITTPYILTTVPSETTVRVMNIEFLNYPAQNFSLPNLQLYESNNFFTVPSAQRIEFDMLNNSGLSQDDHKVTNISLIFNSSSNFILLYLNFTDVYNLDFFLVSELDLCTDTQPPVTRAEIDFQEPKVDFKDIIPTVEEFTANKNVTITCTVSISGVFRWQWMQNGTLISNNDKFHIFTADGSRTSKLQLTGLSVSDAASYSCGVRHRQSTSQTTYVQILQILSFPVFVDVPAAEVKGYLEEREVTLTCEVHGFLQSTNPPVWQGQDGSPIDSSSSKYVISSGSSSFPSVLVSNRSVVSGFRSTLTIRQLSSEDAGRYICVVDGNSSLIQLSVVPGTSPPPPTPTTPVNGTSPSQTGAGSGNAGVVVAVVFVVLIIIIVVVVLVVVLILFLRSRDINWHLPKKVSLPTQQLSMEPLRRLSIRRSQKKQDYEASAENSYENTEESSPKKRWTKADIQWQLPHVEAANGGVVSEGAIYSEVNKPTAKIGEKAPPIPAQNFDPQEEMPNGGSVTPVHNHYENDAFHGSKQPPQRRMTNTSSPKLARVSPGKLSGLDFNPTYETTSHEQEQEESKEESNGTFEAPIYAQPHFKDKGTLSPSSTESEPIYSEAITPDLFSQAPEAAKDSNLTPYAPIYADLRTLEKAKPPLRVPSFKIKELCPLGVGQFGEVMLAETVGLSRRDLKLSKTDNTRSIRMKVAVKKLRPQATDQVRENFEKEITFMSKLKDDNIVQLIAVSQDDPPFIVMEYMENGDLHEFLQDYEPSLSDTMLEPNQLPISILIYMTVQIASGMRYLASLRYVHRDLATRNCLVGQNFVVKISDFGMSRSLYESSYYRVKGRAMLPIRWMASESFYGRFSEKTDVWSYGVTMWEIFTLGKHQPYEDIDDQDLIQDAIRGLSRQLLDKPECCPMNVYEVMLRCWEYVPDERADFEEIFNTLAAIHQSL